MKDKKWVGTLAGTLLLVGLGGLFLWKTGFFAAASLEDVRAYIEHFSPYSHLIYFLVQLASVIVAPIPSNVTAAAGAVAFGLWPAFLLTFGAVLVGSALVFLLARALGRDVAERMVGKRVSERYLDVIRRKRDVFLALVFLFPFFPDDLICMLAGLTDIKFGRFFAIAALTRPWGLLFACALGSSAIQMPVWAMALFGVIGLAVFALGMKYGDRVEQAVLDRFKKDK